MIGGRSTGLFFKIQQIYLLGQALLRACQSIKPHSNTSQRDENQTLPKPLCALGQEMPHLHILATQIEGWTRASTPSLLAGSEPSETCDLSDSDGGGSKVESVKGRRGSLRVLWNFHRFRFGPQSGSHKSFPPPCSPNRACGFPALGSPCGSYGSHSGHYISVLTQVSKI